MKLIRGKFLLLVIISSILAWGTPAHGQPRQQWGGGSKTCGDYNSLDEKLLKMMVIQWVLGYLSAVNNMSGVDFLKNTDSAAILGALDLYCQNIPLDHVVDAAKSIHLQLLSKDHF